MKSSSTVEAHAQAILMATIVMFVPPAFGSAIGDGAWFVRGQLAGKDGKASKDISGIACATPEGFPRFCLVIDDNMQEAQFVELNDGEVVARKTIALMGDESVGKALNLDGEGVAYADGFYYVMGSHGHPRDTAHKLDSQRDAAKIAAAIAASSQIVRFRSDGKNETSIVERTGKLRAIIAQEPTLAPFLDRRLEDNGLTIEGVALRRGRLLAGFRGPSLSGGRAAVLSLSTDSIFGNEAPNAVLYRLPLGEGRGVRDLAVFGDRILVLAGPTAGRPGPYSIYSWDGESENVSLLKNFDDRKAEGLLALDETPSGLRVLILFDGEENGAPMAITVPRP
jgi:hypothetical protein